MVQMINRSNGVSQVLASRVASSCVQHLPEKLFGSVGITGGA
jgi:hypothetical protein